MIHHQTMGLNTLKHENFSVLDTDGTQSAAVAWLEREIGSHGMRCRIYPGHRKALLAGAVIPSGITQATALIAGVSMLIYNLAMMNPDYEICKSVGRDGIEVTC
jgi:hypothetical protein